MADDTNAQKAFETLGKFLETDGWYPQRIEGQTIYRMGFAGSKAQYPCLARIRMDLEQFVFYVMAPVKALAEARGTLAEFLTRANYGLRIGNFELDMRDGEIRYKSSLDFEGVDLDPRLIKNAIYPAVQSMDRYLPGMMAVMHGGASAEAAIQMVEGK